LLTPFRLAFLRLILAFYTLVTIIFSLVWECVKLKTGQSYFSYFTKLSYIGLCAYFWAAGVQTFLYARGRRPESPPSPSNEYDHGYGHGYLLQKWPSTLQFLHVWLGVTAMTFPFLVTIVFWAVLSSSATFSTSYHAWFSISAHALNLPFALFEILFTNVQPAPWITLPGGLLILAAYLGVAYITEADQGFYTYNFLNPHTQHARLAGWIIGIGIAYCIIFVVVRGIVIARVRLATRGVKGLFRRDVQGGNAKGEKVETEAIDEWVKVDPDAGARVSEDKA
jgi:hypothetical protein